MRFSMRNSRWRLRAPWLIAWTLLSGLVTSVLVAWGIHVSWVVHDSRTSPLAITTRAHVDISGGIRTMRMRSERWGHDHDTWSQSRTSARASLFDDWLPSQKWSGDNTLSVEPPPWAGSVAADADSLHAVRGVSGWPFRCLEFHVAYDTSNGSPTIRWIERRALVVPTSWVGFKDDFMLPVSPRWRGLLANSVLYAAAWAFPFAMLPWLRGCQRLRLGRGQACAQCAPDTPGPRRPECGAAVSTQPSKARQVRPWESDP